MKTLMIVFGPALFVLLCGTVPYIRDWLVARRKKKLEVKIEAIVDALRAPYKIEKPAVLDKRPNSDKSAAERRKKFRLIK